MLKPDQHSDEYLSDPAFQSVLVSCLEQLERGAPVVSQRLTLRNLAISDDVRTFIPHRMSATSALSFSPDEKCVATGSGDKTVKVWDVESGNLIKTLKSNDGINAVCFSRDGRSIAAGGLNGMVTIWDAERGIELVTLRGHANGVTGVCFSPDGTMLASTSFDSTVRVWHSLRE